MKNTILILYRSTTKWLSLSRKERMQEVQTHIQPLLEKYQEQLSIRFFDSEAFHAKTSDFLIVSCDDLQQYYFFMEELRDSPFFTAPYIELNDVIIGYENGFQHFEEQNQQEESKKQYLKYLSLIF